MVFMDAEPFYALSHEVTVLAKKDSTCSVLEQWLLINDNDTTVIQCRILPLDNMLHLKFLILLTQKQSILTIP